MHIIAFVFAWSAFGFIHQTLTYFHWFQGSDVPLLVFGTLAWVSGFMCMLRPRDAWRFLAFNILWLANKIYLAPELPNHILFSALISFTIVVAMLLETMRRRDAPLHEAAFARYAPVLRLELLGLYFFVVLHKINTDYMDPQVSCGWQLYLGIVERFPFLPAPSWLGKPTLLSALALEAIIPALLFFRMTAKFGLIIGTLFHLSLALHPNIFISSFTTLMLAMYLLFAQKDALNEVMDQVMKLRVIAWTCDKTWRPCAVIIGIFMVIAAIALIRIGGKWTARNVIGQTHLTLKPAFVMLWWLWILPFSAVFFATAKRMTSDRKWTTARLKPMLGPAVLGFILVMFNGFTPYLGLKNKNSFAMFSNLRTENKTTNHYFMPVSIRAAGYADDIAYVLACKDGELRQIAADGQFLPWIELRRQVYVAIQNTRPFLRDDFRIKYERDGEIVDVMYGEEPSHPVFQPPNLLERKLILFRANPPEDQPMPCGH